MRFASEAVGTLQRAPGSKKNELKPWQKKSWVIPPQQNAEFVCQRSSVLSVYQSTYHDDFPFVCLDEAMKQLVSETRTPISAQSSQPERFDYQYERNGTANLFMVCNPIEGWRTVEVTNQRTAIKEQLLIMLICSKK